MQIRREIGPVDIVGEGGIMQLPLMLFGLQAGKILIADGLTKEPDAAARHKAGVRHLIDVQLAQLRKMLQKVAGQDVIHIVFAVGVHHGQKRGHQAEMIQAVMFDQIHYDIPSRRIRMAAEISYISF